MSSPSKQWRPSTAYKSPSKRGSVLNYSKVEESAIANSVLSYPGINIIKELTGKQIISQDKDIEIERLKTTCFNLNNKAIVAESLENDLQIMKARLQESENARLMLEKENSSLRKDLQQTLDDKAKIHKDLQNAADFNITMEEKVYKSNKISLELINRVKIAEMELGYIYVPVKSDAIDCKLAEYINWSTARPALKSLFTRESEGVYQFGSKRCNIKIDLNKIMVRVGGGYLKIDEFVDQYLPIELEKIGSKLSDYQASYVPISVLKEEQKYRQSILTREPSPNKSIVVRESIRESSSPNRSIVYREGSPNRSIVYREASPNRALSPNTRHSTQIRQSVSLKYI